MAFSPVTIDDFKGLASGYEPAAAPFKTLLKARNVRYRDESLAIRPGLSPALTVPGSPEPECCPIVRRISALLPGDVDMWSSNCRPGPFYLPSECEFTTHFCGIFRESVGLKRLQAWASDDMGFTWVVTDASGFTDLPTTITSHDCYQVGNLIHVATKEATSGLVKYHIFNLETKTWDLYNESVNGDGSDANNPKGSYPNAVWICAKTTGDLIIGYVSNKEIVGADRARFLVRARTGGVWSAAVPMGRVGEAKDSILQRGIPETAGTVRVLFGKAPGGVASAIDDDVQFLDAVNAPGSITTWQTHGISGLSTYGRPFTYNGGSKTILPLWDSGEADLHFFTAGTATQDSVTDLGIITQYGANGSGNASMIAGRTDTVHSIALDWSVGGDDLWAKYDLVAGVGTKVSPKWTSGNNLQELSGQLLNLANSTWLFTFLANLNGDGTFFFLLDVADLQAIGDITIADWEANLANQDATIEEDCS